jgi:DNA-binding PadR family transcriptional regulator
LATSKVEVVVLGLLAEEPMYGYDLLERFRARSMGFWVEVGKASVYQALRRLEREGSINGRSQAGPEGPDRRVYRITRAGRDRLMSGLSERVSSLEPYETDGGLALGFAHLLSASDARKAVDAIKTERGRVSADRGSGRAVSTAMLNRQESLAKAELAWIKAFRSDLGRIRR